MGMPKTCECSLLLGHNASYIWHWWMNQQAEEIGAHEKGLYAFKEALRSIPYMAKRIMQAFTKTLPNTHKQCSLSPTVKIEDNSVVCALGSDVTECKILRSLMDSRRDGERAYGEIEDRELGAMMAHTCAWHMLTSDQFVDWYEGALQDKSDRIFWENTYKSLRHGATNEE